MTNSPIKPIHSNASTLTSSKSVQDKNATANKEIETIVQKSSEVAKISIPRTSVVDGNPPREPAEVNATLQSLLGALKSEKELPAHKDLDPARIFNLLDD